MLSSRFLYENLKMIKYRIGIFSAINISSFIDDERWKGIIIFGTTMCTNVCDHLLIFLGEIQVSTVGLHVEPGKLIRCYTF
jgi:hypothetical protein